MKETANKLIKIEEALTKEKGVFQLFAIFLRENAKDKWDLIVSANWINVDKPSALKLIASKVQKGLSASELVQLSRIVIIDNDNPALKAIQSAMKVEHGCAEVKDSSFFGLPIKHAYLITSQKEQNSVVNHAP